MIAQHPHNLHPAHASLYALDVPSVASRAVIRARVHGLKRRWMGGGDDAVVRCLGAVRRRGSRTMDKCIKHSLPMASVLQDHLQAYHLFDPSAAWVLSIFNLLSAVIPTSPHRLPQSTSIDKVKHACPRDLSRRVFGRSNSFCTSRSE